MLFLERVRAQMPDLRPSERKVAQWVLGAPGLAASMNLSGLAKRIGVSEPTVLRFCKAVGLSGYRQLGLELVRAESGGSSYGRASIAAGDSVAQVRDKIFDGALRVLMEVRDEVQIEAIGRAIELIDGARRVDLFAFGGSVPVAMDAQHKLFRLQVVSTVYSDPHLQHMAASSLRPGDLLFAFSNSGTTEALIRSVRLVREAGLEVIAITPPGSLLAELATVPLCVEPDEPGLLMMPLSARLAWLVLVDVLVLGVAQRRGPEAQKHLTRLLENQSRLRLKPGSSGR